jgi:hypothetical protein
MDIPNYINIQEKQFTNVETANKIAIFVVGVQLFTKAEIHVHFLNEKEENIKVHVLNMSGEDYTNWIGDDNYVINWVLGQLSATRANE